MKKKQVISSLFFFVAIGFIAFKIHDHLKAIELIPEHHIEQSEREIYRDLLHYDTPTLQQMLTAAKEIDKCQKYLTSHGSTVVAEVLKDQGAINEFEHYPKGDVYDRVHCSQYYYHSHRKNEHGHFHTFYASYDKGKLDFSHLVGISMDSQDYAFKLFTINHWITGGNWRNANALESRVKNFQVVGSGPSHKVNHWINHIFILFRPQIMRVIRDRDAYIEGLEDKKTLKDIRLEVISSINISVVISKRMIEKILNERLVNQSTKCFQQHGNTVIVEKENTSF